MRDGWNKITVLPANLSDYYFVLVDRDNDLMLTLADAVNQGSGKKTMWYKTSVNPATDLNRIWEIEANGDGYSFRNPNYDILLMQTESGDGGYYFHTNDQPSSKDIKWTRFLLAYDTDSWIIENGVHPMSSSSTYKGFLGAWKADDGVSNDDEVACNKQGEEIGHYCIYSILKSSYNKLYLQENQPKSDASTSMTWCIFNEGFEIYGDSKSFGYAWNGTGKGNVWDMFVRQTSSQANFNGPFAEMWGGSGFNAQDLNQTIAALPNGKYKLGVATVSYQAQTTLYVKDGDNTLATLDMNDASKTTSVRSLEFEVQDAGNITIGISVPSTTAAKKETWIGVDNFTLVCTDLYLSSAASAFAGSGVLEANKWYVYDIIAEGEFALSETEGIVCTQTDQLLSAASGTAASATIDLTAGKFYFKSETTQELKITPKSFLYEVSEASANYSYVQEGNTVTVKYTLSTNNPDATITKDFSGVKFGGEPITVTPTDDGFTFAVPEVSSATDYTLTIPANAIGYEVGSTYNVEQNITLKTPAVFDGTYFFKVENETEAKGKYMSRGNTWGTHATIDDYGIAIIVKTNEHNLTTLSLADTKRYYYHSGDWDTYADASTISDNAYFNITVDGGKYKISSTKQTEKYLKYNNDDKDKDIVNIYDDGDGSNGTIVLWSVENPTQHAEVMEALKNAQAKSAAEAAFASDNTLFAGMKDIENVSSMQSAVAGLVKGDLVSATDLTRTVEKYQGGQPGYGNIGEKVYSGNVVIRKSGLYKFSMQAFYRGASNDHAQAMHTAGVDFPPVVLYFGNAKTQIKSLYDEDGSSTKYEDNDIQYNEKYYANGSAASLKMFKEGKYKNEVYLYIDTPGTYEYGVLYNGWASAISQWFIYSPQSVEITSYGAEATDAEYDALEEAIGEVLPYLQEIGFDKDEYAPYNNFGLIEKIESAKAIYDNIGDEKSDVLVQSAMDILKDRDAWEWTKNEEEVNAVFDGTFSAAAADGAPAGWAMSNNTLGGATHSRVLKDDRLSEFGDHKSAFFLRFDGTNSNRGSMYYYGNVKGYSMPLKAETYYTVIVDAANWGDKVDKPLRLNVSGPEGFTTVSKEINTVNDADTGNEEPQQIQITFKTTDAGNYVLNFQCPGADTNAHNVVVSNIELKRTPLESVNISISSAGYSTFIAPFEVKIPAGLAAYTVDGVADNGTTLVMTEVETTIPANTPVVLNGAAGVYEVSGVNVATQDSYTEGLLTGVYTETNAPVGSYVLQNKSEGVAFYYVEEGKQPKVKANRAYLTVPAEANVRALFFGDDEATAIEGLGALTEGDIEGIYSANGVKVGALQKGVNIIKRVDGSSFKVMVK